MRPKKLEIVIRAAPPPFRIFAGGLPRRLWRRKRFGLIYVFCTKTFVKSLLISLVLLWPVTALAHGGVQQHVGDTHVTLIQQPLSPLVGEPVQLSFVVSDQDSQPLPKESLTVRVIETSPDANRDREVARTQLTTDSNGVAAWNFVFPAERLYDLALDLPDATTDNDHAIGFLVEPRDVTLPVGYPTSRVLMAMGIGILVGIGLMQTKAALQQQ
ncbi:MAG: hypothetical protein HYY50_00810 [Candidatus Kerfeldbacteria bacterium]|nr:hypothetical protein [Candidatus Kerfeldbacteria bacterium]